MYVQSVVVGDPGLSLGFKVVWGAEWWCVLGNFSEGLCHSILSKSNCSKIISKQANKNLQVFYAVSFIHQICQ